MTDLGLQENDTAKPACRRLSLAGRSLVLARQPLAGLTGDHPWLTAGERQTLQGLSNAKRRREWLGGRLAAKAAAGAVLGTTPGAGLEVAAGPDRAPVLRRDHGRPVPGIWLSISHSGSLAVALAGATGPVGVDIQVLTPVVRTIHLRFASTAEERLLAAVLHGHDRVQRLCLLWAVKEAARKAAGPPLAGLTAMTLTGLALQRHRALGRVAMDDGRRLAVALWLAGDLAWAAAVAEPTPRDQHRPPTTGPNHGGRQ